MNIDETFAGSEHRWIELARSTLRRQVEGRLAPIPATGSTPWVDEVWEKGLANVELAYALIIVSPLIANDNEANEAAGFYRRYSGRAGPILYYLSSGMVGYHPRVSTALAAIQTLQSEEQEKAVFAYACKAAWLLVAMHAIPKQSTWHLEALNALDAKLVLCTSFVLLEGERRAILKDWLKAAKNANLDLIVQHLQDCRPP